MGYIDVDKARRALGECACKAGWPSDAEIYIKSAEIIESLPKEDVAPIIHAHWIGTGAFECSVCHERSCCAGNYCPDCGAKMDEE